MKRILFISALCAFSVVGVQAQDVMIGGLKYHLRSDVPESGSKIILDGGGKIVPLHNKPFELPSGTLFELNHGSIE